LASCVGKITTEAPSAIATCMDHAFLIYSGLLSPVFPDLMSLQQHEIWCPQNCGRVSGSKSISFQ